MSTASIHLMLEEAIREELTKDPSMAAYRDWHYRDLPRLTYELMEQFKSVVGEDNIKRITYADYGDCCRGQLLISPEGMVNISNWNTEDKKRG